MSIEKKETYTNIAYFLAGLLGYIFHGNLLFFVIMTYLSVGSFVYHKYLTGEIFRFDWYSITVAVTCLAGMLFNNTTAWFLLICYQFIYGYLIMGRLTVYKEIAMSSTPLIAAMFINKGITDTLIILAVFSTAIIIRATDNNLNKRDQHYDSPYHSVWHIVSALGFYLIISI